MVPQRRGNYTSYRGRDKNNNILIQYGRQKLIAKNNASSSSGNIPKDTTHPLYKEFFEFMQKKNEGNIPSYANIVNEEDNKDSSNYDQGIHKEIILLLENKDLTFSEEPWTLMSRYLDSASYAAQLYKPIFYYENILMLTGSCEISHFTPAKNKKVYNFSKAIIKKIISPEEWGLSTLSEREFFHPEQKVSIKCNYWDYIESFNKAFLYENPKKKHSWFFKICSEVYNRELPNWFFKWWINYGPSITILPEPFKDLYSEWVNVSPKLIEAKHKSQWIDGLVSMNFFIEFSIPWIWKWSPEVGYTPQNIPCLRRIFFTKFWNKMIKKDKESGKIQGQETVDHIQQKIFQYKEQIILKQQTEYPSPFQHIAKKFKCKPFVSKAEIVDSYITEMKKDLIKNFGSKMEKSDASMATSSKERENQFSCLAGESQDPYQEEEEPDIKDIFETLKEVIKHNIKKKEGESAKKIFEKNVET